MDDAKRKTKKRVRRPSAQPSPRAGPKRSQATAIAGKSEAPASGSIEGASTFAALLTPKGKVLAAHGALSRTSASGSEGLVGQPIWKAAWLDTNRATVEAVRNAIRSVSSGTSISLSVPTVAQAGASGTAELSFEPLSDSRGKVTFIVARRQNIPMDERIADALEAREHFNRTVLDASPDCVEWLDEEGRIQIINAAGRQLLEFDDVAQWRGRLWWDLWPAAEVPAAKEALRQALMGRTGRFQAESQTAKGKLKWWDVAVSPVPAGSAELAGLRALAVLRDVTEERIAEVARGKLAAIVHTSSDAIVSKDLHSVITSWNEAAERIFGYSAEEAIGHSILMLLPTERQNEEVKIMDRIRRGERVEAYDTVRRRKDGSLVEISVTVSPILDSAGRIVGASKIARDISDRRAAEASLQETESRVRLATDATGVGIWEWNLITQNIRWDAQLFKIYGIPPTPGGIVDYETWSAAVESEDLPGSEAILQDLIHRGGKSMREFRIRRRNDGQLRFIHAVETVRTGAHGQPEWVIGTNRDVTELMIMQEALTVADRRKDEFLATLAHELRNPLAPLRMGLEILKRVEPASPAAAQTRAMIDRQLGLLVRLVDDLMDLSRISSGRIELHKAPVSISTVLESALESTRPLIEQMEHKFCYEPSTESLTVSADLTRLAQVFINLLNNAAKYTPRGGQINLSVERRGDEVAVSVRDTGIGISAAALPQVFDMFTQVKGSSEMSQGGLGIGLSLVKRLVDLHGGRVEGRSAGEKRGAEFVVHLKLYEPATAPANPRNDTAI